jgi:hypothetical protein
MNWTHIVLRQGAIEFTQRGRAPTLSTLATNRSIIAETLSGKGA